LPDRCSLSRRKIAVPRPRVYIQDILQKGNRLGPYEIVATAGVGGMGEVYRAHDTRLDRTVAIKILPKEFAGDARLLARFEREAKAISALNHPNICAVHDIGSDHGVNYLVMEYCKGATLADRIAKGPLPVDDALRYAVEIVDALEKVHREGMIHRDLKPSNIMLTKSGVKLLDFGLAKDSKPANTAEPVTEEGQLVGTLNYMAPEVLKGAPADARSDIFSAGTVLYEMFTGRRAFPGDSRADVITSVLSSEPAPLDIGQPLLQQVIAQCQRKDPNDRWQTAHDLLVALRWIRDGGLSAASTKRRRTMPWLAIAAAVIALSVTAVVLRVRGTRAPTRSYRVNLQPPPGIEIPDANVAANLAISPDGEWVAFQGRSSDTTVWGLYLRSTRELDAHLVASQAYNPFFSPDSKWLGYAAEGFLHKVPVAGGEPQKICKAGRLRGATWRHDGTILFSMSEGLLRVPSSGGGPTPVTRPANGERHYWPSFLPGGEHALVTVVNGFSDSWRNIAVVSLKDGAMHPLLSGGSWARYLPSGNLVYDRLGRLFVVKFDLDNLRIRGDPQPVLDDVNFSQPNGATAFDISESGSIVYVPGAPKLDDAELVWVDRDYRTTPVLDTKLPYGRAAISPDGLRLAVTISTTLEDSDLFLYDLQHKTWTRLTFNQRVGQPYPASSGCPVWTPDGNWIICLSGQAGHPNLFRIRADGNGQPQVLTSGRDWEISPTVSRDGTTLLFGRQIDTTQWDIMSMSLQHPAVVRPFLAGPNLEFFPNFSPDGRWVAYESLESGSRQIHVRPFDGAASSVRVSTDTGWTPRWSRDGREIFYQKLHEVWSVRVETDPAFKASEPRLLFKVPTLAIADSFDISPDGTRFLMVRRPAEVHPDRRIVFIPNWADEAAR